MVRKLLFLSLLGFAPALFAQEKTDKSLNLFGDTNSKGPTIVTASEEATFDSQNHVAVFVGTVQVQDPQFSMTCDRLTVQLDKDQGGMKQADADGHVFIVSIRKNKETGEDEKSTGKGEKAIYTPANGRIALYGWPQIQQKGNTHIATEATTKMYLFKDGHLETNGGSRTVIQAAPKEPATKENTAPK